MFDTTKQGRLLEAMRRLQESSDWERVTSIHGEPVRPECNNENCCNHTPDGGFLPWHTHFVNLANKAIHKYDPAVTLPYWDWTTSQFPSIANSPQLINPQTGQFTDNPFYRGFIPFQKKFKTRNVGSIVEINPHKHLRDVLTALKEDDFYLFSLQLQFVHNDIHDYIGGDMFKLATAAYDPIFYLHHTMIDLIWAVYQKLKPNSVPAEEVLEREQLPFGSRAVDQLYTEKFNLDIHSDRVVFGGMTLAQINDQISSRKDRVFAGFFLKTFETTGRIHFDICVQNDCSSKGGDVVIFGGKRQVLHVNPYPVIVDVTHDLRIAGIDITHITDLEEVTFNVTSLETINGNRTVWDVDQPIKILRSGVIGEVKSKYHRVV